MRVGFDARAVEDPATGERGVGRYAGCLLDALERLHPGEVVVLRSAGRPARRGAAALADTVLARELRRMPADVVHSPSIDRVPLRPRAPLVVTLHDLLPLKQRRRYLRTGLAHRLRYAAVRRAARVVVPSRAVADDAERLLGLDSHRLVTIGEAPAPVFGPVPDPRSRLQELDLPDRFLLWVGGLDPLDPRKGVEPLAAAVRAGEGRPLVLAGRPDERSRVLAAPGRVVLVGRVGDEQLAALYTAADALVFPSEDEGFGLPPLEALACGTAVAAYAAGGIPEAVAGAEGVELVERGNLSGLLAASERLAGKDARAPRRSWDDVARETWRVYEAAAGG